MATTLRITTFNVENLDGNDPRGIDVGVMLKRDRTDIEIVNIRTHVEDALLRA
jgi:hypothetical protein